MGYRVSVIVRFTFEALHHWPGAPQDVTEKYLSLPHRHLFHVEAKKEVNHNDRDIEFIELRREMQSYCSTKWPISQTTSDSCEKIATDLLGTFGLTSCEVNEDGDCGGLVEVPEDFKAAYLAGVIDSDGSISLHTTNVTYTSVALQVQMNKPDVPEWIALHFGGTTAPYKGRVSQMWCWRLHGSNCSAVLEQILPYLVLKKRQCQLALALCALILPRGGHRRLSTREIVLKDKIAAELKLANGAEVVVV